MIRAGFVIGAKYGKGLVSCRTNNGWSHPSYIELVGGSWGAQIGVQSVDLVLVFVRANAADVMSRGNFTLGADASIAAGPIGRGAQVGTDYKLSSEIYSYSVVRGLFAGIALQGTSVQVDRSANRAVYGNIDPYDLLTTPDTRIKSSYTKALRRSIY